MGLDAVVAFTVRRRTREIAVRISVRAPGGRIVRRFVSEGVRRFAAIGIGLGLPVALLGLAALPALDSDLPSPRAGLVAAITAIATAPVAAADPAVVLHSE